MPERAIGWWQHAGAKAREGSNFVEAERQLTRAVKLVQQLPEDRRDSVEFDLQMALGAVYRAIRGTGSVQTEQTYARARALCEKIGGENRLLDVLFGQFLSAFNRPKLADAERYAREFMAVGERCSNPAAVLVGHQISGMVAFLQGQLLTSRSHLEDALRAGGTDP